MTLYLLLNIASLSIPLIFSFHPKIQFYKKWKGILVGLLISTFIYIVWDIFFTKVGIWGFNERYLLGPHVFGLPIEEWMFFICIPYASVFTHYSLIAVSDKFQLNSSTTKMINWIFGLSLIALILLNSERAYTFVNGIATLLIFGMTLWLKPHILNRFYLSFLVVLIPFFIVNGVLTGSFIQGEIVWYNNAENLGIRLFTIPVEDTIYAFGLILLNILVIELVEKEYTVSKVSPVQLSSIQNNNPVSAKFD